MSGRGGGAHAPGRRAPDRGATFVEILVSIVLLGTVVIATLAGLRATIIASQTDEQTAKAHAWLQAAADAIEQTDHRPCSDLVTAEMIRSEYASALSAVQPPDDWDPVSGATLEVVRVDLLSLDPTSRVQEWDPRCSAVDAADSLVPQLVTLRATAPDGDFSATIEVIKGA